MRVLLTGASGRVGTVLTAALADEFELRGLDIREVETPFPGEFVQGDCADPEVAARGVDGVQAVVHLAGVPSEAPLATIWRSQVETTAMLLDAMVQSGVDRMVYASSNHAVGMTPRTALLGVDTPPRPDTFYGVGKVAAEALLSLYADRYDISSLAMRIGSFGHRPSTNRELSTWLSYDDCTRMVRAGLTGDFTGCHPIYGVSNNTEGWWDLAPGRALGYDPRDDAASFGDGIADRAEDAAEGAHVGGSFVFPGFDRRPMREEDA